MITVHHLNKSRSTRVLWLLEELQLPYQVVHHQRDEQTQLAPASMAKIHPLSKAPIMVDGDITLCESAAILEYLLDQDESEQLRPEAKSKAYYQYLEWLHFAEGSLSLPVITSLFMQMEGRKGDQAMDGYIAKELNLDFSYIDATLGNNTYFAGEQFTAADVMMTISLEIAASLNLLEGRKNILAYLNRVQSREAYQKARALG